jgi:iron complex transport system substrate-binding protein
VLCIIDRTPGTLRDLYAAIEGSFLAELIVIAGGSVVGGAVRGGYGRISKEAVLTANPDIVLDLIPIQQPGASPELAWRDLPELKAVRRGGVHIVREEYAAHDSQLIAKTAVVFAQLLHPEVPKREWEPR